MDESFALPAILNQVFDRAHLELVLPAKLLQVREPGHVAVWRQYLADYRCLFEAGQSGQIHASLRVAGADQHSSLASTQAGDMPLATHQVVRRASLVNGYLNSPRAIKGRGAGGDSTAGI